MHSINGVIQLRLLTGTCLDLKTFPVFGGPAYDLQLLPPSEPESIARDGAMLEVLYHGI